MPRPVRRSFIMASPSTTMSPVARDEKKTHSDITDHRMTRGDGLCDQFQSVYEEERGAAHFHDLRGSPDHVTDESSLYSPMAVISAIKRYTPGLLMNYLTYSTALSYAENYLFLLIVYPCHCMAVAVGTGSARRLYIHDCSHH